MGFLTGEVGVLLVELVELIVEVGMEGGVKMSEQVSRGVFDEGILEKGFGLETDFTF